MSIALTSQDGIVTTALIDALGRYSFSGLSTGRYAIQAPILPGTYRIESDHSVDVTNARACLNINFQYQWDGRIRGRMVTITGEPVSGMPVALLVVDDGHLDYVDSVVRTDAAGEFEIIHIPPGHYRLGYDVIESNSPNDSAMAHPPLTSRSGRARRSASRIWSCRETSLLRN